MSCILLVEDDYTVSALIQEVLEDEGYSVYTASDEHHVLELLASIKIDLIITDLAMPQFDGVAFCHALRANLATAHIPILVCSGRPESLFTDQRTYTAFLTKPFALDEFLHLVAQHILPNIE